MTALAPKSKLWVPDRKRLVLPKRRGKEIIKPGLFVPSAPSIIPWRDPRHRIAPRMQITIDSQEPSNVAHNSLTSPLSYAFTNTAGNFMVFVLSINSNNNDGSGNPTASVTYGGNSMSLVTGLPYFYTQTGLYFACWIYVFTLVNPPTGSNTIDVTWTFAGAGTYVDSIGAAITFDGAGSAGNLNENFLASGSGGTDASVSVPGTVSGDYVVNVVTTGTGVVSATSPTVLSAMLNVSGNSGGDNLGLGQQATSGGTVTAGWTVDQDFWGIVAIEIFPGGSTTLMGQICM